MTDLQNKDCYSDGTEITSHLTIFPGVNIFSCKYKAYHCVDERRKSDLFQLNFCMDGRFECMFTNKECGILGAGDMAANLFNGSKTLAEFPLGYYEGIGVLVNCEKANAWGKQNLGVFALDFAEIKNHLLSEKWYRIFRPQNQIADTFFSIHKHYIDRNIPLLRLKTVELFMYLKHTDLSDREYPYYPKHQVDLIKQIKEQITSTEYHHTSVEQLAKEYGISASQLQKVFHAVYGMPVYKYIKEYRLEKAANQLRNTPDTITEIAATSGFSNPAKFTEAFKQLYGDTPSDYRSRFKTEME